MTEQIQLIYLGAGGFTAKLTAPANGILVFKANKDWLSITGVRVSVLSPNTSNTSIFNLKQNGTNLFSGELTIAAGANEIDLTELDFEVDSSDEFRFDFAGGGVGLVKVNLPVILELTVETTAEAGASAFDDLTDVALSSPQTNDVLVFNGTDWVNSTSITLAQKLTAKNLDIKGGALSFVMPEVLTFTATKADNAAGYDKTVSRNFFFVAVAYKDGIAGSPKFLFTNFTAVPYSQNYQLTLNFTVSQAYDTVKIYRRISTSGVQILPAQARYDFDLIATVSSPTTSFVDVNTASAGLIGPNEIYWDSGKKVALDRISGQVTFDSNIIVASSKTSAGRVFISPSSIALYAARADGSVGTSLIQVTGSSVNVVDLDTAFALTTGNLLIMKSAGTEKFRVDANGLIYVQGNRIYSVPSGGTTGQVLVKNSGTDGDVGWSTVSASSGSSLYNPDEVPVSPNAFDDEFASSIDGSWTQVNNAVSGTTTFSVVGGELKVSQPYQTKIYPSGVQKNVPSGDWTIEFKMKTDFTEGGANTGNYSRQAFGVWVNCGTYKYLFGILMQSAAFARGGVWQFSEAYSTGSTSIWSNPFDGGRESTAWKAMLEFQEPKYYRVQYAGTTLSFHYSHNRKTWFKCYSLTATPTTLLFGVGNYQSQAASPNPDAAAIFDWIRRTA